MRFALPLLVVSSLAITTGCGGGDEEKKRVDPATLGQAGSTGTAGNSSTGGSGTAGKAGKSGSGGASAGAGGSTAGAGGAGAGAGGASAGAGGSSAGAGGSAAGAGGSAGGAGGASGGSGGASGGAAGKGGSPPYMGPDGNGTVAVIDDTAFTVGNLFGETATVTADASDPSMPPSAAWTGAGKFALTGVAVGERVWFSLLPTKPQTAYLPTLSAQTVPADGVMNLVVPVVKGTAVEAVLGGALDPSFGYVVFVLRAPSGAIVQGGKVKPMTSGQVFYDSGNNFSSSAPGTGAKGLAVIPNAPANPAAVFNLTGTTTGAEGPVFVDINEIVRVEAKTVTYVVVTMAP